ncbi:MAG: GNAT family N-acetyltransferase [Bdellovibrio sp.]|nr:GNAT family N-acetyltransferase [Bdellovibrio sp.]
MTFLKPNFEVTEGRANDFENLAELYETIASTISNKAFFNWNQKKAEEEIAIAKTFLMKDEMDGSIQAFVTYRDYQDRYEISAIGTNPKHLKMGFAQKVLTALQANAAQRRLAIWLEVHENNQTAINLYLKNGFKVLNTRKRYYPDGGDALVMQFTSV